MDVPRPGATLMFKLRVLFAGAGRPGLLHVSHLLSGLLLACTALTAHAVSLGAPVLESALGQPLRVVLPVLPGPGDKLTAGCIKLRGSRSEANDISERVRADVVTTGDRQAVVLTTVRAVNELVVSFAMAVECGTWFTRRFTFLLDLPKDDKGATVAAAPAIEAPVEAKVESATPAAPAKRSRRAARTDKAEAATTERKDAGASRDVRPEDEPGVLSRKDARKTAKEAKTGSSVGKAPMAPPVRSMLKIQLGGLDEFLASEPRLQMEEQTGMRLATGLSAAQPSAAAALAADTGFKLAHARYLAAMRDAPDPMSTENVALNKRLDAFSKDLASLKVDLQKTRARADELEASRVPWWWLLIVGLGAAAAAFGLAMLFLKRSTPTGPLIVLDELKRRHRAPAPVRKDESKEDDPPTPVQRREPAFKQPEESVPAPRAVSLEDRAFSIPELEQATETIVMPRPIVASPVTPPLTSSVTSPLAPAAPKPEAPAPAPVPVPALDPKPAHKEVAPLEFETTSNAPPKTDKNSLTQQLATMPDLSDEAWASYRHSSDTSGVAVPFGVGSARVPTVNTPTMTVPASPAAPTLPAAISAPAAQQDMSIDFQLDLDGNEESTASASQTVEPPKPETPAARKPTSNTMTGGRFLLETLDLPPGLTDAPPVPMEAPLIVENAMPNAQESIQMFVVMASASSIMETAAKHLGQGSPSAALRTLGTYLQSAPAKAPPGPWVMLAHVLHQVGMQREYAEAQALFKARFGVDLPDWDKAYELMKEQLGLARVPGLEILAATERGKPGLIGRLAGVAYRVDLGVETLFDLALHREVLQMAANCRPGISAGDDVDLAL